MQGLELIDDTRREETTILKFRRLLERHGRAALMMNATARCSATGGALLKGGTMVDATTVHASSSTKNEQRRLTR